MHGSQVSSFLFPELHPDDPDYDPATSGSMAQNLTIPTCFNQQIRVLRTRIGGLFFHSSSFDEIIFLVKPSWCPLGFPIKELPIFQNPRFPTTTYASLTSTSALWCWCITPIAGKTGNCLIFRWMQDATLAVSTCRKSTTFVVDFPNYNLHL